LAKHGLSSLVNIGGDPDWYGYCLDDPVNGMDRAGLMGKAVNLVIRLGIKITGKKAAGKTG
jgi:hypothetical protein